MKFKTSKKAMRDGYDKIISIGYCNAQFLLQYENPIAYSTRAEGWACDYYDIDGVLISTGYAPLETKNMKRDYAMVREYDKRAQAIVYGDEDYTVRQEKVRALLVEFISKATEV